MLEGVNRIGLNEWEVPVGYIAGMRVPGRFFLFDTLYQHLSSFCAGTHGVAQQGLAVGCELRHVRRNPLCKLDGLLRL